MTETMTRTRLNIKERIKAGIRCLGKKEKLVVSLRYMEELSFADIGEVMGLSMGECVVLHAVAMKKLRAAAEQEEADRLQAKAFCEAFDLDIP